MLDFDGEVDVAGNGLIVEHGGTPAELTDCLDDKGIEQWIDGLNDLNVGGAAGWVEVHLQEHFCRVRKDIEVRAGRNVNFGGIEQLSIGDSGRNGDGSDAFGVGWGCGSSCSCGEREAGEQTGGEYSAHM